MLKWELCYSLVGHENVPSKNINFRLTSAAQNRLFLSSLLCNDKSCYGRFLSETLWKDSYFLVFFFCLFQHQCKHPKWLACRRGWSGWMWKIYPAFCSSWRNREIRWERFCRGDNLIMITLPSITHQRIWWSCYQWRNFPTYSNFYKNFKMRLRGAFWNRG